MDPWERTPLWALLAVPLLFMAAALIVGFGIANANHAADPPGNCRYHTVIPPKHGTDSRDVVSLHDSAQGFDDCYGAKGGNDNITARGGYDNVWGGTGQDYLDGGEHGDAITGDEGADTVLGRGGPDRLYGGPGNDTVSGHDAADNLFGGGFCNETDYYGFDSFGSVDITTIPCGTGGADVLQGGPGDDWLWESNSDQVADGSVDQLWGGGGYDICTIGPEDTAHDCEEVHSL